MMAGSPRSKPAVHTRKTRSAADVCRFLYLRVQEDADSPRALSPASTSSQTSSPHLAWTTGHRRNINTILDVRTPHKNNHHHCRACSAGVSMLCGMPAQDDEEATSAVAAPDQAHTPTPAGCSGRASESASDGFPPAFRRSTARPARQGLLSSPELDDDSISSSLAQDCAPSSSSRSRPARQQDPLSPPDSYAFSSGRGRRRDGLPLAAASEPAGAASPGASAVVIISSDSSSGNENSCGAWSARAASPDAASPLQDPLAERRWVSPKSPGCPGLLQQEAQGGCTGAPPVTPRRAGTAGRPPRPGGPPGQRWAPCSVPALPRMLPRVPGAPPCAAPQLTAAAFKRRRVAMARSLFDGCAPHAKLDV